MLRIFFSQPNLGFAGVLMLLLFGLVPNVNAQQRQQIFQTSPEASALTKMVNYPVNFNTGVPNITIPLYEIQAGDLKLPIELSYHAGGFKIHEQATRVGLGWSLTSDIQITRTINGLDDFAPKGYINNPKMKSYIASSNTGYPFSMSGSPFPTYNAYLIAAGEEDGMPDQFNYKLLNKSGSFYFRKDGTGSSYTIVPVPYDNIKITFDAGKFTIIDTDGTTYVFGSKGGENHAENAANLAIEFSGPSLGNMNWTAWKCKAITNATKTESIEFSYQAKGTMKYRTGTTSIDYFTNESPCGMKKYFKPDQISASNPTITTYENLMSSYPFYTLSSPKYIVYGQNGNADFHLPYLNSSNQVVDKKYPLTYASSGGGSLNSSGVVYGIAVSRIDFRRGAIIFNGADALNSIEVKNSEGEEIKTFAFFHSYVAPMDPSFAKSMNGDSFEGTRYLDSIQLRANNVSYESYKLVYAQKFDFGNHIQGKDAWGFSNMSSRQSSYFDQTIDVAQQTNIQRYYMDTNGSCPFVDNVSFTFGNNAFVEATSPNAVERGMLKRIIYPTGGFVNFDYEGNMYRQKLENSRSLVGMGGGVRINSITYYDGKTTTPIQQKYYRYGELEDGVGLVMNTPNMTFNSNTRNFDAYSFSQIVAYITGPESMNAGSNFDPIPVGCYNRSCLYMNFYEKKTTYLPTSAIDYGFPDGSPIYYTKVTEYNQDLGKETGKKVYSFYQPNDFKPYYLLDLVKIPGSNISVLQTNGLMGKEKSIEEYKFENNRYSLVHSKAFTYTKRKQVEDIRVAYAFFGVVYKVIGGNFNSSYSDLYNTNYAYSGTTYMPYNEISYGDYGIQVGRLLLSSETEKWVKGADTVKQVTTYEYDNSIYQQATKSTIFTAQETRSTIFKYAYDFLGVGVYDQMKANNMINQPIEVTVRDDLKNKEISKSRTNYGYSAGGGMFIAPTSILTSYGGGPLDTVMRFDRYDVYGNILEQREKSNPVKSFIWGYNSKYPVAQIDGASYASATAGMNMTTFQSLINESQIRTVLNGVRALVPNAMVATYTYKPLIGTVSETKPNGISTFYEYDPFGRLIMVKDQNQQIINRYQYRVTGLKLPNATSASSYNTPIMQSYNVSCLNSSNVMVNRIVNVVREGGTHINTQVRQANFNAENYLELNWSSLVGNVDCNGPVANVLIQCNNWASSWRGYSPVYLDFIKDNSIVFSKKMPPINTSSDGNLRFYIEPGEYKVSIRLNENYVGMITKFELYHGPGMGTPFVAGDTVNFQSGEQYTFVMFNN